MRGFRTAMFGLVLRQIRRRPTRSVLTIAGVGVAMFLFVCVQTLQMAVARATQTAAQDTTLIVYRENRFCPATSRLPEHYQQRIGKVPGVVSVVPMKIVVNNCRASLDVVTFRGVWPEHLSGLEREGAWRVVSGSLQDWNERGDAAIVGARLAERRRLKPGQSFDAAGVTVTVAAVIDSQAPQDQNVAYVHMRFLQQAARSGLASSDGLGVVTQFAVKIADPARLRDTARAIDDLFRTDPEPTSTRPEKAFVAQAGADIVRLIGFTRVLGWGCLAAVLALVANAIVLSVQDRVKEHAVMQTLGFRASLVGVLVVTEGVMLAIAGGAIGAAAAGALAHAGNFTLSNEGLSIVVALEWRVLAAGLGIAAGMGVLAGVAPAVLAGRREIAACFRAV